MDHVSLLFQPCPKSRRRPINSFDISPEVMIEADSSLQFFPGPSTLGGAKVLAHSNSANTMLGRQLTSVNSELFS